MTILALIAMVCGPIQYNSVFVEGKSKNCYKQLLLCVEHKHLQYPKSSEKQIFEACLLEM